MRFEHESYCMNSIALQSGPARKRLWPLALLSLALLALFPIRTQHMDDRLYFWARMHWHADDWLKKSVWLPDYQVDLEAIPLAGISNNLSGLTYDPDRNILWAVTNGPNELLALSRDGQIQARYPLEDFHDVEAVSYAGRDQLVIAEERRQSLVLVPVPIDGNGLLGEHRFVRGRYPSLALALGAQDNKGLEGVTYDLRGDRLFATRERDPRQLLQISGLRASLEDGLEPQVRDLSALVNDGVFATDLSSVVFDQRSGHLILLSDESKLLIEMTDQGKVVSFRSLATGFAGLRRGVPQAEGVTLDDEGNLYLVSEPNLFYRFTRTQR